MKGLIMWAYSYGFISQRTAQGLYEYFNCYGK